MSNGGHQGVSLHTKIMIALVVGAAIGSLANVITEGKVSPWLEALITYVFNPVGQVFLAMLFMTVIPLVFSSLALGVAQLGGGKDLGRIGLKTF
ncbi:MAG TPA: cation:dicarboxylase symporter family transporter, partial [Pirellula sp.]|nr:cation:dicarboxylase symporter family transporter [Pirellula sp.]